MTTTIENLAESILRKFVASEEDPPYISLHNDSACVDGWVEGLTTEEVDYLVSLGWRRASD